MKPPVAVLAFFLVQCGPNPEEYFGKRDLFFYAKGNRPPAVLAKALMPHTRAVFGSGTHSAAPVAVGSLGPEKYIERLKGIVQNTDIAHVMARALKDNVNVILVVGDGMGMTHLSLPVYSNIATGRADTTNFEKIMARGQTGICLTNMIGSIATGSGAAATAFAAGKKTRDQFIGLDNEGNPLETVLEQAQKQGKATGLITDTKITHATPAVFYAKTTNRKAEADIAAQLVENVGIDVLMGGGARYFIPQNTRVGSHPLLSDIKTGSHFISKRTDKRDLVREMAAKGYGVSVCAADLDSVFANSGKILGLYAGDGMNATIDRDDEETGEPSLPAMTRAALGKLSKAEKGYFLMVECGRIDWESHRNDAGAVLKAMMEMDEVLGECLAAHTNDPGRTLLIFTSDHETGNFGICYSYNDPPPPDTLPNGHVWKSKINFLPFSQFLKYGEQKKSFAAMIDASETPAALVEQVGQNSAFTLSLKDARAVMRAKKSVKDLD
jgi:alkaline phosphatase